MKNFHKNDSGTIQIRYEVLPSGKVAAFGVALTDLIITQSSGNVNFDKESDEIFETLCDSKNNRAFQYSPGVGFIEVDIDKQKWFIF